MSADYWGKCPKCGREENLREDYEIGFWKGTFNIDFHAECGYQDAEGCGYRFHYRLTDIDPFEETFLRTGRVTSPTMPKSKDPSERLRELRDQAWAKLTPEERASLQQSGVAYPPETGDGK